MLLATNYDEAVEYYQRYKRNLLGVISDVGFVLHKGDSPQQEKADAGIDLCRMIKADIPLMPVLMQSSQTEYAEAAHALGAGFIAKGSKRLLSQLRDYIEREFAFGDFRFIDPDTGEEVSHAKDLMQMQQQIATIPDAVFEYHTSQNHLSKWLYARGLFPLAKAIRRLNKSYFQNVAEHRAALVNLIRDYRTMLGQGVVARFDASSYSDAIGFARIGDGSLGGKARGLAFMNSMLTKYRSYDKFPDVRITIPRSVVIATGYFDEFISINGLEYVISQELSDEEVIAEFVSSTIPPALHEELRSFIATVQAPLAIRSSSKLEDSHYQPFAGIYSTYMVPHVKNADQMLRLIERAVKSVYASVYFASSRSYIATSQNLISEEKMAVIIQEVCGTAEKGYFMPTFSGVARSINYYPIGDERPEEGVCNIAMGLGKQIVDGGVSLRFSPRYPQHVLQTSTPELAMRDTQRNVLALDLNPEAFRTSVNDGVNIHSFTLRQIADIRQMRHVASVWSMEEGRISDFPDEKGPKVLTFNNILRHGTFPLAEIVQEILAIGTEEMRCPVEVEFAVNMDVPDGQPKVFNLLQIRPIIDNQDNRPVDWSQIDTSDALIFSDNALGIGRMNDICDIVYVKPASFSSLVTQRIAEELLALNARMRDEGRGYILVGTGRWGSSDPFLGVPVRWEHISEAKAIAECALDNFNVEPSQGTHFFQNVTSLGVGYMTIDQQHGHGHCRFDALDAMEALWEGEFLRLIRFDSPLLVCIDGRSGRAAVKIGGDMAGD